MSCLQGPMHSSLTISGLSGLSRASQAQGPGLLPQHGKTTINTRPILLVISFLYRCLVEIPRVPWCERGSVLPGAPMCGLQ